MADFEDLGLGGGVWRGLLRGPQRPGRVLLVHLGEVVGRAEIEDHGDDCWQLRAAIPAECLSDGCGTFQLVEDGGSGDAPLQGPGRRLASLPIIAGRPLDGDLRTELSLLRAELELLKREFRRRGAETA